MAIFSLSKWALSFRRDKAKQRRKVYVNQQPSADDCSRTRPAFPSNEIRTTRYTLWTFLPLNLAQQMMEASNLYFLGLDVLQSTSRPTCSSSQLTWMLQFSRHSGLLHLK